MYIAFAATTKSACTLQSLFTTTVGVDLLRDGGVPTVARVRNQRATETLLGVEAFPLQTLA